VAAVTGRRGIRRRPDVPEERQTPGLLLTGTASDDVVACQASLAE
jgi:hypothetical protein